MKTRISQVVAGAIFSLVLVAGTSFANETKLNASSLETMEEPAMQMENWMIDDVYWNELNSAYLFEETIDADLNLESWMTNDSDWGLTGIENTAVETEASMDLESWMTNDNLWGEDKLSFVDTQVENENELNLESWMTDENTWNIQ